MTDVISEISKNMIERYSNRYNKLGYDAKTLGWGNTEQQIFRFNEVLNEIDFTDIKTVLDIGCGFGDLLSVIIGRGIQLNKYLGWDINSNLIKEAQEIWKGNQVPNEFKVVNIAEENLESEVADAGVMLGVLNLNLKEKYDNYAYSELFIKKAFGCVKKLLVVDFLSEKVTDTYPKEDFVFYHDPGRMLEFAFTLTPNVLLKHSYQPIPQKEFMLYLYK
jgi:SAM-dependent methyltransferase